MKKNFFKKLSFVLALAMIVSVVAPAAGVFAAAKPKLNSSEKYLFLGQSGKNKYDFNISNKKTGWKYSWSSSNESVAAVNKSNGLATAKKIGTTTVSVVIKDAKGKEVTELAAKVIVKDNIKTLAIKAPAATKFSTNTDYDFNRSFVTDSGSTSKTTAVTRWSVSGDATINDNGVFKAAEAGKYTITARAFQSKAKYTEWLALNDATATKNVLATATYEVNVVASMTKVEQVDLDTFKVTFDTAVTDVASKIVVTNMVGTTEVVNSIKNIKMSDDNKVATVDMNVKFTEKSTYIVKYPEMDSVQFVAATSEVADVKSIAVLSTTAQIGEQETLKVALYNANGVNVADDDLLNRVSITASTSVASYFSGRTLTMYTLGDTTTVSVIFHTYNYDTSTGQEVGTLTASGVVTCVAKEEDKPTSIAASTIKLATKFDNFTSSIKNVSVGDQNYKLFVKLLIDKAGTDDTEYWNNGPSSTWNTGTTGFQMSSSNSSVLIVDDYGNLYPVSTGTVSVIVKYKEVVVGAVNVTVGAKREVSVVSLDTYSFTLSNNAGAADTKTVTATVKDQFGDTMVADKYTISVAPDNTNAGPAPTPVRLAPAGGLTSTDPYKYVFSGSPATEGTTNFKIVAIDSTSDKQVAVYVTVTTKAPSITAPSQYTYKFETNKSSYDMKLSSTTSTVDVSFKLAGYATNGIKDVNIPVTGGAVTINVIDPNGNPCTAVTYSALDVNTGKINLIGTTSGGSIIAKEKTGTWTVRAVSGGTVIASTFFTVTDSQPVPVLTVNKTHVDLAGTSNTHLLDAIKACVTLTLDGADVTPGIASLKPLVQGVDYSGTDGQWFVNYIHYYEEITTGVYIDHKVTVNRTFTIE